MTFHTQKHHTPAHTNMITADTIKHNPSWIITHSLPASFLGSDATAVSREGGFAGAIRRAIHEYRPKRIFESGTYMAQGTTAIIAESVGNATADFVTVEANNIHYGHALGNIMRDGMNVRALLGLSLPRKLLPTLTQIQADCVDHVEDGVYIDFYDYERAQKYWEEGCRPAVPDDLMGLVLAAWEGRPDFVLLDSAGHLGWIEFQYALSMITCPCTIALDDVNHWKHYRSWKFIKNDPRFTVLAEGSDKFGWGIARFT